MKNKKDEKENKDYPMNSESLAAEVSVKNDLMATTPERKTVDPEDLTTEDQEPGYGNVMDQQRDDNLPQNDVGETTNVTGDNERNKNTNI